MRLSTRILLVLVILLGSWSSYGQTSQPPRGDSWAQLKQQRQGVITILWEEVIPFAYHDSSGRLVGIEVELLESFARFVQQRYGYTLRLEWRSGGDFKQIYERVRTSANPGVFGLANYSVTPERLRQVQFAPVYMPDLNVLVTHPDLPLYASAHAFIQALPRLKAYTIAGTTMAQDVDSLRHSFYPALPVQAVSTDYALTDRISHDAASFGYVPLAQYLYHRQRGFTFRRQAILLSERMGYAGIYPLHSDWHDPLEAYANAPGAANKTDSIVKRYLGTVLTGIAFNAPQRPSKYALDMLSLQKEVVTQRLISTALDVQAQKIRSNLALLGIFLLITVSVVFYIRAINKQQINQQLITQNQLIGQQRDQIDRVSRQLKLKMLQAQLNPHFIFNSLNAIQYFIMLNEKRNSLAYMAAFARFMRQMLTTAAQSYSTVREEVQLLEQYLSLEKMRFAHKFDFTISADYSPDSALTESWIPTLFIHSFVERILYHGLMNRPAGGGTLKIHFDQDPVGVRVTLTDNGVERPALLFSDAQPVSSDLTPHWASVLERLALFNAQAEQSIRVDTGQVAAADGSGNLTQTILYLPHQREKFTQL